MVHQVPAIWFAAAMLALVAAPAGAQSMDGASPPRSNSEYPRAPEGSRPFEELTHNQMVPLRVNPARLDSQSRSWLERSEVMFQPYRILATNGGPISITTGPRADVHNNVTRVGTTLQICNRDVLHHQPFSNSREAESWATRAPGSNIPGNLARLAPGQCFSITPDRPGVIWMNCEYHRNEIYAIVVLPADHDLSDENVQGVLLWLSGGRSGSYAVFREKPRSGGDGGQVREMCALPHRWRNEVQGLGSSVWVVDANGRASESGMASVTAKASFAGNVLTIEWQNNVTAFYYRIPLDSSCGGTGELVFTRGSPGHSSYPATFTSLGGGKQ